jgi:hypothetical protein
MVAAHKHEDVGEAGRAEREPAAALVLKDYTPARHMTRRRSARRTWEGILFASAAVVVLLFFAYSLSASLWRAASRIYAPAPVNHAPAVTIKVSPGETLWHLAAKYGAPDSYQLDRVEDLARENHLSPDSPLIPGQSLHIVVRNPVEIAKLQRQHRVNLAALPR